MIICLQLIKLLYVCARLVAEFPASGGIVTSADFRTVKLLRYVSPSDFFVMACEILFMLLVVYYIVEEIIEVVLTLNECTHLFYYYCFV